MPYFCISCQRFAKKVKQIASSQNTVEIKSISPKCFGRKQPWKFLVANFEGKWLKNRKTASIIDPFWLERCQKKRYDIYKHFSYRILALRNTFISMLWGTLDSFFCAQLYLKRANIKHDIQKCVCLFVYTIKILQTLFSSNLRISLSKYSNMNMKCIPL